MTNPFEDVTKDGVFESDKYLDSSYIPEKLLFRDEEMDTIYSNFKKPLQGRTPSHMLIHGPPGAGKTHAVQKIVEQFNEFSKRKDGFDWIANFFSAEKKTYYQLLTKIARNLNPGFPQRGYGEAEVQDKILELIRQSGQKHILIIDEVDKMNKSQKSQTPPLRDVVYFITRANELDGHGNGSINLAGILIGNEQGLDDRVERHSSATASAYHPEEVYFREYNANELVEIIKERCEKAFRGDIVEMAAINFLAAQITKHSHDLRFGFEVLKRSGDKLKELPGKDKIDEDLVERASNEVRKSNVYDMISKMNSSKMITLWAIVEGNEKVPPNEKTKGGLSSRTFYKIYKSFCDQIGLETRSQSHITQIVTNQLETQGFISTDVRGLGRGRGKTIVFHTGDIEGLREATKKALENNGFENIPTLKRRQRNTLF